MVAPVILWRDADDEAGVGVPLVARILAHAVGHHAAGLAGRRHHGAARAHAEAVDGAAVAAVMRQRIGRRAQIRVAGAGAEHRPIDPRLRMLDAEADRERLGLDMDPPLIERLEGVARRMADGEDHVVGLQGLAGVQAHAPDGASIQIDVRDPVLEPVFPAQGLDLLAHGLDHGHQAEGADVRMGVSQDLLRRPGRDKLMQHLAGQEARILDLAVELAVGEGARAALAILDVGFRMQLALAPQFPGVLGPLPHHLAAVENDRLEAHLGQDQSGEQAARPGPDHDGPQARGLSPVLRRDGDMPIGDVRRGLNVRVLREPGQHRRLVLHLDVEDKDFQDRRLLARVMRPLPHRPRDQIVRRHAQTRSDRGGQGLRRVVERQFEFGQAQHRRPCSRSRRRAHEARSASPYRRIPKVRSRPR